MSGVCRDCGQGIAWGIGANGARIPLDPQRAVYHALDFNPAARSYAVERTGADGRIFLAAHLCSRGKDSSAQTRPEPPDYRARRAGADDEDEPGTAGADGGS